MICQNNTTSIKYNAKYQSNQVRLWNPTSKPKLISKEEFESNYTIIDKFLNL